MTGGWTVIPYGRRWAVQRPDQTIRCIVDDREFALEIMHDCINELTIRNDGILCVETGIRYESTEEAAKSMGLKRGSSIGKALRHGTKSAGYHWRLVEG